MIRILSIRVGCALLALLVLMSLGRGMHVGCAAPCAETDASTEACADACVGSACDDEGGDPSTADHGCDGDEGVPCGHGHGDHSHCHCSHHAVVASSTPILAPPTSAAAWTHGPPVFADGVRPGIDPPPARRS